MPARSRVFGAVREGNLDCNVTLVTAIRTKMHTSTRVYFLSTKIGRFVVERQYAARRGFESGVDDV